jgi:hypothetical protein
MLVAIAISIKIDYMYCIRGEKNSLLKRDGFSQPGAQDVTRPQPSKSWGFSFD